MAVVLIFLSNDRQPATVSDPIMAERNLTIGETL